MPLSRYVADQRVALHLLNLGRGHNVNLQCMHDNLWARVKIYIINLNIISSSEVFLSDPSLIIVWSCHWFTALVETWLMWPWHVKLLGSHNLPLLMFNCSFQPSMVNWLSSPIFPCSLFVCLSRYSDIFSFSSSSSSFFLGPRGPLLLVIFGGKESGLPDFRRSCMPNYWA